MKRALAAAVLVFASGSLLAIRPKPGKTRNLAILIFPGVQIIAARGWQNTSAAAKGRVYCIRDEFLNTPAPTLLDGLDALAWAIHPEVFPRTKGIRRITAVPGRDVASNVSTEGA